MRLSPSQISAALALVGMTQEELASVTGMSRPALNKILNEETVGRNETLKKIRHALEARGVEFIGSIGVQWSQHQVRTLTGVEGLKEFFDDVRAAVKKSDDEIVISGIAEDYLENKLGDYLDYHRREMAALGGIKMRCLIKEGDGNISASDYCQYRWQLKEQFAHVPFYGQTQVVVATRLALPCNWVCPVSAERSGYPA